MAKQMLDTILLDFVVINTRTGNACASFLLPRDALHYIKWRRESEGPHGPDYEIRNADGTSVSDSLHSRFEAFMRREIA